MNEKVARQIEEMKKQTIGVEVEMNNITREKAAKVAARYFGTRRYENTAGRNGYSTWSAWDAQGREGTWKEAAERFENCWAPDILGWWYSRHCLGEKLDMEMVLRDAKEECPLISAIELEPHFEVILNTDSGKLRIRYRSQHIMIGHSYFIEKTV